MEVGEQLCTCTASIARCLRGEWLHACLVNLPAQRVRARVLVVQMQEGRSDGSLAASFLEQAPVLLDNCAHPDAPVSTCAAACTAHLVRPPTSHHAWIPTGHT